MLHSVQLIMLCCIYANGYVIYLLWIIKQGQTISCMDGEEEKNGNISMMS